MRKWILVTVFTTVFCAEMAKYAFHQSIGELIEDLSGNEKWAINGDSHENTNKNMYMVAERGLYNDGQDRRV